jgi:predicted DNA-binding transcriptional regulator AlpA
MTKILNTTQAAEYIGRGPSTVEKWRVKGLGPKFVRVGPRCVGYTPADLDEWIASLPRCTSTSEVETPLRGPGRPRKRVEAAG